MKVVKRIGVFETNSSSTHSMVLLGKDKAAEEIKKKPKLAKFRTLTSKKDKLLMACGCCHELYPVDESDSAAQVGAPDYEELKKLASDEDRFWELRCDMEYYINIELLVGVYCELTGEDAAKLKASIYKKNESGRACHMAFFEEGALYDERCDYDVIDDLFLDPSVDKIIENIRNYFDDDNVLYFREYWNGMGMFDDD